MSADHDIPPTSLAPASANPNPGAPATVDPVDCWNRIGIFGNKQCAELADFIHCRNCPVYATAGSHLLQRRVPDSFRREWAAHYAQRGATVPSGERSVVVFKIGSEWLALPTLAVQEIAERRPIHSLPHRNQEVVLGLANVRGELTICISLGHLMGLDQLPACEILRTRHRRLLVATNSGNRLAFPAEDVTGTERFGTADLKTPPLPIGGSIPGFIQGILSSRGRLVGLIDPEILFSTIDSHLT